MIRTKETAKHNSKGDVTFNTYDNKEEFINYHSELVDESIFMESSDTIIDVLSHYKMSWDDLSDNINIEADIRTAIEYFENDRDAMLYSFDSDFIYSFKDYTDIKNNMVDFLESYRELLIESEVVEEYGKDWEFDIIVKYIEADNNFTWVEYEPIHINNYGSNIQIFKGDDVVKTVYSDDFMIPDCLVIEGSEEEKTVYKMELIDEIINEINEECIEEEELQYLSDEDRDKLRFELSLLAGL